MDNQTLIFVLFAFTLLVALALGIWQLMKTRRAKLDKHHSAMTHPPRGQ